MFIKIFSWFFDTITEEAHDFATLITADFGFRHLVNSGDSQAIQLAETKIEAFSQKGVEYAARDFIEQQTAICIERFGKKKMERIRDGIARELSRLSNN